MYTSSDNVVEKYMRILVRKPEGEDGGQRLRLEDNIETDLREVMRVRTGLI